MKVDRKQVRRWRREMESEDPDQEPGLEVSREQAERTRQEMGRVTSREKRSETDPDARFLRERGGRFRLGYNGEVAVSEDHFIVAVRVTQNVTDNASLLPMVSEVERQCRSKPEKVLADSGYYTRENLDEMQRQGIDAYVPDYYLARELNTCEVAQGYRRNPRIVHPETHHMRQKLRRPEGRKMYEKRKSMVEPVIGTLKEQRGMRQFLRRGLVAVSMDLR